MQRLLALIFALGLVAAACGDDAATVTTDDAGSGGDSGTRPSVAGDWILEALTVDGAPVALPDGALEITIELGRLSGDLGCNSFSTDIDASDDGGLALGAISQTEMACLEDGRMEFESTYGQALAATTAWSVDPDGLTLSGDTVEIRYIQSPPLVNQPLEGTVWQFDTLYSGEGPDRAATNRADMAGVTLVIADGEATLAGPGCPGGVSTVTVEHDDGFEGAFTVTRPGGSNDAPECEIVVIASNGLAASTGFMIDENRLTFVGEAGETVGFAAQL